MEMNEFIDQGESRARRHTWGHQDSEKKGREERLAQGMLYESCLIEGNADPIFQASPESSLGHYPTNI